MKGRGLFNAGLRVERDVQEGQARMCACVCVCVHTCVRVCMC